MIFPPKIRSRSVVSRYSFNPDDFLQELTTTVKSSMSSFCITSDPHSDCLFNRKVNAVKVHLETTQKKKKEKLNDEIAQYDEIIKLIPDLVEHEYHFLMKLCH